MLKNFVSVLAVSLFAVASFASNPYAGSSQDRDSLRKTSEAIRAAFARGDIADIMANHDPDVIKALSPDKYLDGRDAVGTDRAGTLDSFHLEFTAHRVENLLFQGDPAVEQSVFTVKGTPKNGGEPFLFRGRALVVCVRYKESPTGWASIRELVQPFP